MLEIQLETEAPIVEGQMNYYYHYYDVTIIITIITIYYYFCLFINILKHHTL